MTVGPLLEFSKIDSSTLFWITVLVAVCLATVLYLLAKFALRRFRFSNADLKAAGLNHSERRRMRAKQRRKKRQKKMRF